MTFGETITDARKRIGLTQRELANRVVKEDGEPITPQYLNDIEHDRRNPSSPEIIEQFAEALGVPAEVLYYLAGTLPEDLRGTSAPNERIVEAFGAFRKALRT